MKLGIGSYTYGWAVGVRGYEPPHPLDEEGLLDKAKTARISLVQIGDNLPLHTFTQARLDCLAARAAREGIGIEIGARGLTAERIVAYLAIARRLQAPLVRFVVDDTDYHPSRDTIITLLRGALPELGNITLALENHDRFPAAVLRHIVESVDDARVGICLDTANSLGAGEGLENVAAVLAPFVVNLHLKDVAIERLPYMMGFTVTGRPAGSGQLDLLSLLASLEPFGRCRSAILELWTPPEERLEDTLAKEAAWADRSLAYLRRFFPKSVPHI